MELQVFCLNCWGIPIVAKNRKARFKAIAEALALRDYDIVCLQEVWTDSDFNLIKNNVKRSMPYQHYFYSGVMGSGLCLFSKYPILQALFYQWSLNGYVHKIQHGDWYGGKGIGLCKLRVNEFNIDVYTAHLHAAYSEQDDEYRCHRVQQAYDSAQFIQLTSSSADVVILAGDLNTEPGELPYRIFIYLAGLKDSFNEVPDDRKEIYTIADDRSHYNSYRDKGRDSRIDYVLYRSRPGVKVLVARYANPLPSRIPDQTFSYSDHEAILSTLRIERAEPAAKEEEDRETCISILRESTSISGMALRELRTSRWFYWIYSFVLLAGLVGSVLFDIVPYGLNYLLHFGRFLATVILSYTFFMATLWYKMEYHGILAGKLTMEIDLNNLVAQRGHSTGA